MIAGTAGRAGKAMAKGAPTSHTTTPIPAAHHIQLGSPTLAFLRHEATQPTVTGARMRTAIDAAQFRGGGPQYGSLVRNRVYGTS